MSLAARLHVTREGWYWLLGSLVLCLTGLVRGINLVTLLGCVMLVVWALHLLSSYRRLRGLTGRRFLEEPIFARAPFALRVEVNNSRLSQEVGLVLEETGPTQRLAWRIPALAGGGTARFEEHLSCSRRGPSSVGPLVVSTSLPFGLAARTLVLATRADFVVLPRLGQVHRGRLRRHLTRTVVTAGKTPHLARPHPAAQADLHGLRRFRTGDSPRWIHWRTSARKGELMVREMEDMSTDNLILVFDPELREGTPDSAAEQFEMAVSLAATICWEWCRQTGDRMVLAVAGTPALVVAGVTGRDLALRMLRGLAVQRGVSAADGAALLTALSQESLPSAPVLVVAAGATSLGDFLGQSLRRVVVCVNVADGQSEDFFEMHEPRSPTGNGRATSR